MTGVIYWNNLGSDGTRHEISKVIYHPEFDLMTVSNDLALIKIKDSIKFSNYVKKIDLPTSNLNVQNLPVVFAGWGKINEVRT